MIRQVFAAVFGLCIPCRHPRQTIGGRKLRAGVHEMFLVCSRCGKRISPGVLLGPGAGSFPVQPSASAADLATADSLAK